MNPITKKPVPVAAAIFINSGGRNKKKREKKIAQKNRQTAE
jgi:hypothetical protein